MANFFLLVFTLWMLSGLVLLTHYLSPRYGFAPLLLTVGVLTAFMQSQLGVYIEPAPGFIMFFSSNGLVPLIIMVVLVLYIANGSVPARLTIFGLLVVSLLTLVLLLIYRTLLIMPGGGTITGLAADELIRPINPRTSFASLLTFVADMFVMVIFYQGLRNRFPLLPEAIAVGLALLAGLWTDAIVFRILADLGTRDFLDFLPGDVLGKTVSALILWLPTAFYLVFVAPRMPDHLGAQGRLTLDVLFGSYEQVKLALIRTEKALERSESRRRAEEVYFRQIADNINEALWLAEAYHHHHAVYVNAAYEGIWGRSAASLNADPDSFRDSIHPEDRDRILNGLEQQTSGSYDVEYRVVRPDGTIRWVRDRAFPIRNERGQVYRVAGITEDITERKHMERQMLELAVEREKVKMLHDFVSESSHDLKTPLTAINLVIYRLQRTDDPDKRRAGLDELAQLSKRMGMMIDDLLTLARLENVSDLTLEKIRLNSLIGDILSTIRPLAEDRNLALQTDLAPADPCLLIDRDDMLRAFTNLIDNAVRYTPTGGVVSIQTRVSSREVLVEITDTGIGIRPADLPNIFNRFFRAANARSSQPNGTGLGLAITRKIIEQHRGCVEVHSIEGQGTTFTVRLPGLEGNCAV